MPADNTQVHRGSPAVDITTDAQYVTLRTATGDQAGTLLDPVQVTVVGTVEITGETFGGGEATIADGADVTEGAIADAAVVTDTTGTISGKLRGLVKWAFERMPASLGQKAKTASLPVVIASDQDALAVTVNAGSAIVGKVGIDQTTPGTTNKVSIGTDGTVATTVANGANVPLGSTADSAVTSDTTGTAIGFLRGLVKWAFERMPASLGQKAKTASLPVVIASDQDALATTINAGSAIIGRVGIDQTTPGTTNKVYIGTDGTVAATVSGTVTVQQSTASSLKVDLSGTAANSTAVKVDGSAVRQPTSQVGSAYTTNQVSIASTATQILASNSNRMRAVVINTGTTDVYIGVSSGVTTSTGQLLKGIAGYPLVIRSTGAIYGIVASGSQTVTYQEETV